MYQKLNPLKSSDHSSLRLLPVTDYSFARGELVAPIVIDEIADVAREYPIVFPKGSALPAALLGVEKDANAYVGADGKWLATYIPAHIRQYPLAMARMPAPAQKAAAPDQGAAVQARSGQARFAVLVDMDSSALSQTQGEAFFGPDGKLTPALEQKMRSLDRMQMRARITQRLVKAIEAAGLLTERAIRIKKVDVPEHSVTGLRVIDEAALNKLDDAAFNQLRKAGALPLVYAALLSWANFRQGQIGKSHPLPAGPVVPAALADDVIRFN